MKAEEPLIAKIPLTFLGKILRIHDDGKIPVDNPYYEILAGNNRAIWSLGHRNPFNLTYDWVEDRLYATDVGGGTYEEINLIEKGKNYGWPIVEGPIGNQTPPENYQDPYFTYAYDVGTACAIVGLAIYRPKQLSFGANFDGALFFADYCGGTISYLEGADPKRVQPFASELDRPLNVLVDVENGNLYFHTRAGDGGGSPDDNTISENGALWQLFFKGDGSPEIVNLLKDAKRVVGEDVFFQVQVIGTDPLEFQWYVNDQRVNQSNSSGLLIEGLALTSHGAEVKCVVTNSEGQDTSNTAELTVLDNQRPQVEITTPISGQLFRAGDTIHLAGFAQDAEDGRLPATQLAWKLEFHHNDHTHPLLKFNGRETGTVVVPVDGETSENVWIRIHLSATDSDGLEQNSFVEVFPDFAKLTLESNLPATVSIDGAVRTLPITFNSMIGLNRAIEVPEVQNNGEQLIVFREWSDGFEGKIRTIQTGVGPDTFSLYFEGIPLGSGSGLLAEFWNGEEAPAPGIPPDLVRIDTVIDFGWDNKSPDPDVINRDFFFGRWQGFIEAPFSEEYTLSIASDDGARMWIDDELIFNHWQPQATTEHFFNYTFEAGKKYPIKIEYFELEGGAAIHLRWQSEHTKREIIPRRQLYSLQIGAIDGVLFLDREGDETYHGNEESIPGASVILLDESYRFVAHTESDQGGRFSFEQFLGDYYLHVITPEDYRNWQPSIGLDMNGFSALTSLEADSTLFIALGFRDDNITAVSYLGAQSVKIRPNPTSDWLEVVSDEPLTAIKVFDLAGRSIIEKKDLHQENISINVSHFNAGFYFMEIEHRNTKILKKFVKN